MVGRNGTAPFWFAVVEKMVALLVELLLSTRALVQNKRTLAQFGTALIPKNIKHIAC